MKPDVVNPLPYPHVYKGDTGKTLYVKAYLATGLQIGEATLCKRTSPISRKNILDRMESDLRTLAMEKEYLERCRSLGFVPDLAGYRKHIKGRENFRRIS